MNRLNKTGYLLLLLIGALSITAVILNSAIEQEPSYHHFSDTGSSLGLANFWNVFSNIGFLVAGVFGLLKLNVFNDSKIQYLLFFLGVTLVSFGSGYYHLQPSNETLIWDRLPMTIAFMALLSIIVSEFIDQKRGIQLLFPFLVIGLLSVVYWMVFGDLRFYILVQFTPMLAIPVILLCFKSSFTLKRGYWFLLLAYIVAKLFEHYDFQIQQEFHLLSGHSLKHLTAAGGISVLLYTYIKRSPVKEQPCNF